MNDQLAQRVLAIKPSETLTIAELATELKAQGKDIINLSLGEPDFDTPNHIKEAAVKALQEGKTKLTAVDGIPDLKSAIQNKLKLDNKLNYELDQIIVSVGAKQVIYNLMQATLDKGDEVIIPAPYWVSYPDMVTLSGAKSVIIKTTLEQSFKITPQMLEQHINENTKMLILNSPSNPTGVEYSKDELLGLAEILLKYPNILIISDDIYEHIRWSNKSFVNIINVCPKLMNRTFIINGVSKTYSMTGWRIGYCAGQNDIVKAMKKIQSQSTSNPCSFAQFGALAALNGPQDWIKEMVGEFKKRHDFLNEKLNAIPGIDCLAVNGTFYIFPNVEKVIQKLNDIDDDIGFAKYLLNECGLAVVPGSAFGAPNYIRLSFVASIDTLRESCKRIEKALSQHKKYY